MTAKDLQQGLVASDFYEMVNASDVCMLLHDAETFEILWANPAACALLEFDLDEMRPLRANLISSAAQQYDRIVARALLGRALTDGASRIEWHLRSRSGRIIRTDAFAVRVRLAHGDAIMVQYRDIEREHEVDEQLRMPETYVDALTRHTSTIALMLSADGTLRSATDTALNRFQLTQSAPRVIIGRALQEFARITRNGTTVTWSELIAASDPLQPITLQLDHEDGRSVWLEGSVEHLAEQRDDTYLLIAHDVTDRVRGEELREIEQHRENYHARYNAMGDMAMAIAHELGQPLAAAGNFIAGAKTRATTPEANRVSREEASRQVAYGLDSASRQLERAAAIVNTLRAFVGHLEHIEQIVDLNEIVRECLPFIRLRGQPERINVELELTDEPIPVRCERVLTGQVLLNLAFNAIDEMVQSDPAQRVITIRTSVQPDSGVVTVADRGRGVVSDPFNESFTGKEKGSGIGLALSHRIVTRQHGRIWFEPRQDGGSEFSFTMPMPMPTPTAE